MDDKLTTGTTQNCRWLLVYPRVFCMTTLTVYYNSCSDSCFCVQEALVNVMNSLPNVSGNFVWASLYLKRERFASMMAPLFENSLHKNSTKNITPLSISCPTGFSPNPPCLLSLQGWAPRSHFLSWLVFGNLARKLWGTTSSINTLYWVTLGTSALLGTRRIVWKGRPLSVVGGAWLSVG